jgi:hypothetical protein
MEFLWIGFELILVVVLGWLGELAVFLKIVVQFSLFLKLSIWSFSIFIHNFSESFFWSFSEAFINVLKLYR